MTLLQPAALFFAALAPVIIVLYLLKVRRQAAQVSTLMFWQRVTADNRRQALFQRLRQLLSLLLHLLILALLILALARPEFRGYLQGTPGAGTVVILDCRARMQVREKGGVTRFSLAQAAAASYLQRASTQAPAALLSAGFAPRVAAGFSGDQKPLLDALGNLSATDAGGRIEDALRSGADLLSARGAGGRIVLVTDHAPAAVPPNVELRLVGDPAPRENVGLTRLSARPLPNSPDTEEVLVELENFGPTRQSGTIELSSEGALLDVKPYDLAPGEKRADAYPTLAASSSLANARGWLSAHLAPKNPDGFSPDDDAYAVIPPPHPLRALLVTRGNLYLESLLKADHDLGFDQLAPDAFQPAQAAGFDAVILDDFLPPGFDQPGALPQGNYLFVRRTPFDAPGAAALDRPPVTDVDPASPLLRLVDLRDILFFQAANLALPESQTGWRLAAPVRTGEHPLVITGERGRQRLAAFAFGAADSELPLRVAFPLLMRNSLNWIAGRDEAGARPDFRAGEPVQLPAGVSVWTRVQRAYAPLPATIPPAELVHGPGLWQPSQNGFYLRRDADGHADWLAVNTGDREMSALNAAATAPANTAAPTAGQAWARLPVWPPWMYLALAGFALCTLEWWTFHRRRTE